MARSLSDVDWLDHIHRIYIVGLFGLPLWDAYIGTGVDEWGQGRPNDGPSLALASFFWFIAVPFLLIIAFCDKVESVKERRLKKNKQAEKLRIAAQYEIARYEEQLEQEIRDQVKKDFLK